MSVLINNQSGFAEDLPQQQADMALQQGTHGLPLNDEQGNPVIASLQDAPGLIKQGHSQPSPGQLNHLLEAATYQSPMQQARAFDQGAMKSATFGLSSGALRALGADPEDMRKLEQYNPGTTTAGEVSGLLGSALIDGPLSAAGMLTRAGEGAAAKLGLGAAQTVGTRIGAAAVKGAVETAMIQGGDEVSKAFLSDPDQTAQTALINIGLSGVLGGVIGGGASSAKEALWKTAQGSKLTSLLSAMKNKVTGVADATAADEAAKAAGMDLSPEMRASMTGEPQAMQMAEELRQSGAKAGSQFRESIKKVEQDAANSITSSLGRTVEDLPGLRDLSDYDSGQKVQKTLGQELKGISDPISAKFEPIKERFSAMALPQGMQTQVAENLGKMAAKEGYTLSESSPALKEINRVISDMPNLKTLEDLRKYQSVARQNLMSAGVPQLGRQVGGILREAEESTLNQLLSEKAPELVAEHQEARASYKSLMETVDSLNDRLHVGKYYGPGSFLSSLKEMAPEDVLRRIKGTNDGDLLKLMQEQFPQSAKAVQEYHADSLLKKASIAPGASEAGLNTRTFYRELDKMSPELKEFALGPSLNKLNSVKQVLDKLPKNINPSGTARTLDALWKKLPGGIGSMLSMMTGHNPVIGYILGQMGQFVGREAPDAMKLAVLKALGSSAEVEPGAFKTMFEMAHNAYEGNRTMTKAIGNIFKDTAEVLPERMMPKPQDHDKIEKHLKAAELDPSLLTNKTNDLAHYLPEQAASMGMVMANASQYLRSLRPSTAKLGPMDSSQKPNGAATAQYKQALSIAEQPLVVLNQIKDGTFTPSSLKSISTMYPALYSQMKAKMMESMTKHIDKGGIIPYKTQMSMSLFMGIPLNSSLTPQGIISNQMTMQQAPQPQQRNGGQPGRKTEALKGISNLSATQSQAREIDKKG